MNTFQQALRNLMRHLRAGELALLGLSLILAVAGLSSVSFLTDRMGRALAREANQMLGGDMLLAADHSWSPTYSREAAGRGLATAETWLFTSMVGKGEAVQLAGVKAASPGYPLRGVLRLRQEPAGPDAPAMGAPPSGSVWLDERLAAGLDAKSGDVVSLGNARYRVGALLAWEADRGNNFFALAPRLLMNLADVPATGLVVEGSRVTYRLHLAGEPEAVAAYGRWARSQLGRGEQLEDIGNARPELRTALDRANRFLRLSALLSVILAAVAVGLAARRFMERNLDACAVMRCLGARQGQVMGLFLAEFLILGLACGLAGCLIGFAAQWGLEKLLDAYLAVPLPTPSFWPVLQGMALSLVLLAGFACPQLLRLARVSTLRVLRREWEPAEPRFLASWGAGLLVLTGLMFWIADDLRLGALVCGGFLAALLLYGFIANGMVALLARSRDGLGMTGEGWRLGIAALARRRGAVVVQSVALGLGLTALLLLTLVRGDLLETWKGSVPANAPNRFVINIQPDEQEAIREFFRSRNIEPPELMPMIRGRLVAKNGRPVRSGDFTEDRARHLSSREFNLSWAAKLPEGNRIVAGEWFPAEAREGWSVEEGIATTLGLALGDRITFDIAGTRVEGTISSLRKLEWDSMRVNFFVVAPPGVLESFPSSYITSFRLAPEQAPVGRQLVAAFPTLTLIDVTEVLEQLQRMFGQLSMAVQCVFLFTLGAGLLVLFSATQATFDERTRELAILRTLGARHIQLKSAILIEFGLMGIVAALLSVGGASLLGLAMAHWLMKTTWIPSGIYMMGYVAASAVAIAVLGAIGLFPLLYKPVVRARI